MCGAWLLKSVGGLCPRSAYRMGHRPPLDFCRCWFRSLKVLLWRLILSLSVNLQPPRMCVLVTGDWHLVHMRDGCVSFCICGYVLPMPPPASLYWPGMAF